MANPIAHAASRKGFEAKLLNTTLTYTMAPGETKTIDIAYKNIGKETWNKKGNGFVSMYTFDEKERKSVFATKSWIDTTHPVLLKEKVIKKGATGHFSLTLKAPKTIGSYKESFDIVSEDTTWIPGGELKLNIDVAAKVAKVNKGEQTKTKDVKTTSKAAVVSNVSLISTTPAQSLDGMVLLRSANVVTADAGEQIAFKVGVKNTGVLPWTMREIRAVDGNDIALASVSSTAPPKQVAVSTNGTVTPGALEFMTFAFIAPTKKGSYVAKYQFAANGIILPNLDIDIPIEVTSDAGDLLESPLVVDQSQLDELNLIAEPIVRVGVLIVDEETSNQVIVSCNTDWTLTDGTGTVLSNESPNQSVTAFFKNQLYYFDAGQGLLSTKSFLRFVPRSTDGVCKIENFDKRKTRHAAYAENTFRNILEIRYNSKHDRTWMINEVPMEMYLHGLGETSEYSNYDFKKTLIVIARTFALYQWERATKHASEFFHMNSSGDDQVYKGYEYEMNNPSIARAAEETRGVTVNYNGRTAITPYFSRSDGRTRDWTEVWNGTVAWIKSVPCPCDAANGRKLWGHGVGLSASEALCMAKNGSKWDDIIHYFYQGIDLKKRWN